MKDIKKYTVQLVRENEIQYSGEKITSPKQGMKIINQIFNMSNQPTEIFVLLALNTKKYPIRCFLVSQGTIDCTIVSPRDVFQRALLVNAHSIIVAHNHPSGDPTPSKEDKNVTQNIRNIGEIMRIELVDHIIFGDEGRYFSFAEQKLI